jgi:hypothetical protein
MYELCALICVFILFVHIAWRAWIDGKLPDGLGCSAHALLGDMAILDTQCDLNTSLKDEYHDVWRALFSLGV